MPTCSDRTKMGKSASYTPADLRRGKTYYYPARDHLLKSDPTSTQATIFLVASPNPVADLETRLRELERLGKDQMRMLFPQATIRSLSVRLP